MVEREALVLVTPSGAALHRFPSRSGRPTSAGVLLDNPGAPDYLSAPKETALPTSTIPVAVLGAGLTGLSTAFHLRRQGVMCRVVEKAPLPGGHAITVEEQGYRFDRTGHLLHLRDPEMRDLALSWIGPGALDLARRSRVFSRGVYTRYPYQANTFGLPPEVAYACVTGFLKAHFAAAKPAPRSFEDFCRIHFGDAISDEFMIPYNTKLWGVHPREISAAWCSRFVPLPRLEDVIAGAVGMNDRELGYNARFTYPRLGIGQLAQGLARAAGEIELSREPRAIDPHARTIRFEDETLRYDALVSTMPLPRLVGLLTDAPPDVRAAAAKLRCTHLHYLDIALNSPCQVPYHWIYVPEERYPFYRVGSYSNFSAAMAPPNKASLYVELASREAPDLAALLPRIQADLLSMKIIDSEHAIRFARARTIEHAYVVFDDDYDPSLATITAFLRSANIVSAGRYGGWNYSSMEDALLFGRDAARQATSLLCGGEGPESL